MWNTLKKLGEELGDKEFQGLPGKFVFQESLRTGVSVESYSLFTRGPGMFQVHVYAKLTNGHVVVGKGLTSFDCGQNLLGELGDYLAALPSTENVVLPANVEIKYGLFVVIDD